MELHEVKGAETRDWQLKWKLTKALLRVGGIKGLGPGTRMMLVKRSGKAWATKTESGHD
jgi:hypothetical protein